MFAESVACFEFDNYGTEITKLLNFKSMFNQIPIVGKYSALLLQFNVATFSTRASRSMSLKVVVVVVLILVLVLVLVVLVTYSK